MPTSATGTVEAARLDEYHIPLHHKAKKRLNPHGSRYSSLRTTEEAELTTALRNTSLFQYCRDKTLSDVIKRMKRVEFKEGEILLEQNDPQDRVFLIIHGSVARLRFIEGQLHQVETVGSDHHRGMFGALHVLRSEPTYATALAETDGVAYTLESTELNKMLDTDPELAKDMLYSLTKEVFRMSKLRTPLLEQDPHPANMLATSLGASIESYYRSGLNAWLNAKLTGRVVESFFPNFHIQIPARILYINGFKQLRGFLSENVHPGEYGEHAGKVRLASALVPGIIMTPMSSLLEACNAGHMNNEPLHKRWTRGLVPRCGREMIFGIGLNQLSDACEERVQWLTHPFARTCAGSLMAGVTAGYLSHVPHAVSTLKLLNPHLSYRQIWSDMVDQNLRRTPKEWVPGARRVMAGLLTVFLPRGCLIRTTQICGSFIIINGTIQIATNLGL